MSEQLSYRVDVARRRLLLLPGLLAALSSGCTERLPMAPVRGTVLLDGQPLEVTGGLVTGTVTFVPETPGNPYAYGEIGPDGGYELTTKHKGDGAVLGSYRIMLSAARSTSETDPEASVYALIPGRYGSDQMSGLTAVVKDQPVNIVDLELASEPRRKPR